MIRTATSDAPPVVRISGFSEDGEHVCEDHHQREVSQQRDENGARFIFLFGVEHVCGLID